MNASVHARRAVGRLLLLALLVVAMLPLSGLLNVRPAFAAYISRFNTITTGAVTFTGNTLGLSKQNNANAPGTSDGIGTFITTNTAVRETTYPLGTTGDWRLDSSAANLTMPAGSTVLYAELIWSGSYSYGGEDVSASLDTPITFKTPGGQTYIIPPDPTTAQTLGTKNGSGRCTTDPDGVPPAGFVVTPCFYVRSANVTAQVQAAGAGAYITAGVPGTQGDAENTKNNAGWTLAVAYENTGLPARNLALFLGAELTNATTSTPVTVSGFCTPPTGALAGRLLLSATEGDANRTGDQMQFGPTAGALAALSGPNRPVNNFFASQINNDAGTIDTTGTFGTRNHNALTGTNISGGRQGWDIANVDISTRLQNSQTSAVAQGTSTGDQYVINALGTQIGVGAPRFPPNVKSVDKAQTFVGDFLTYTIRVDNTAGTADAINLLFKDPPPAGTSFVPGSFAIDGVAQPGADPSAGVNMGTIALGTQKFVTFRVRVDALPTSSAIQFDNNASWTYQYVSCAGQAPIDGSLVTNQVRTTAPLLQPSKSVTPIGPVAAGTQLTYAINVPNNGTAGTIGTTLADSIPAGTTYVPGSTTLNGAAVADLAGPVMPFTTARLINSPGAAAGTIAAGAAAVVQFRVTVNAGVTSSIENVALIDQDGPGGSIPPIPTATSNPVVQLSSTKAAAIVADTAPPGGSPGDTIEYTIKVANAGSGPATGVSFNDTIPAHTAYVAGSTTLNGAAVADAGGAMPYVAGQVINSPGAAAGTIAAGATATITFRVQVDNPLAPGVTQVVNQGTVSSNEVPPVKTDDPNTPTPGDPTVTPLTSAPLLSADKAVSLQVDRDGNGVPSPNDTLRYTVTIINSGNGAATGVVFNDTPDSNTTLVAGSVTTTQGTIAGGNAGTPPVIVTVGTIPGAGGKVTITFDVRVITPLPAGVRQVVNQGTVSSDQLPSVPTNDPATPAPNDPTITPLLVQPKLEPFKRATLFVDADKNGAASPGDTILYDITINNTGNAAATGVTYSDTPDANTTLVVGSVQTSVGAVTNGNAGTPPVTVNIGTIPGGASVTLSYKVTLNSPLPAGVKQVVNQGIVSSNELPPAPTSDPTNPIPGSPTIVPVVAAPVVAATKTDTLLIDADASGAASPGDTLLYRVSIGNTGNTAATGVVFDDAPDSNTTLVNGSVQTNLGTVTKGNTAGDTNLSINIGALPVGASVSISFRVTINNPLPAGVTQVANQGIVSGGNFPTGLTDDPDTPAPNDPNITPIAAAPVVDATKTAQLFADADGNGRTSPGDILLYTVTIRNSGNSAATGVTFVDLLDSNTTLVVGSVQASQGTVTTGNTAGNTSVAVIIGAIPGGSSVTISYRAAINSPLPAGVTQISNQAIVSGNNIPTTPSNNPTQPGGPTDTPVTAAPQIIASKIDKLFADADKNGVPSPGDTLLYQMTIQNTGNAAAPGMKFTDVPDPNTKLVVGSVQTSQGTVTGGNSAGDISVAVSVGSIPGGGASVTISFLVTINNPIQGGVTRISNQGVASGTDTPAVPTDDPTTPEGGDPTITPIAAAPVLTADKAASLFADPDNNGVPSPGDTLLYQVIIRNIGNTAATGVTFTDTPDANTTLVAGSARTSQGTITGGNAGTPPVAVDIGTLPSGAGVTITFLVTINNPLPPGVTRLVNQGTVNSNELPPVPTNDPTTPEGGDPTITPIAEAPVLAAEKTDILFLDADKSGLPSVGDTLLYVITITNRGNIAATGVVFSDTPDVITTLVAGSVQSSQGSVTKGNSAGDTSVGVDVGTIPTGASVAISFQVTINTPRTRDIIFNQGTVNSNELPPVLTDDPTTPQPGDPTITNIAPSPLAISLASFTATRRAGGVAVNWVTTAEINTWGFYLYRSADGSRAGAVRVTAAIIPGQGRGQGGAAYSWIDTDAQPGVTYSYWLQEVELNGTTNEYGPATAGIAPASQHSVFLPVVYR